MTAVATVDLAGRVAVAVAARPMVLTWSVRVAAQEPPDKGTRVALLSLKVAVAVAPVVLEVVAGQVWVVAAVLAQRYPFTLVLLLAVAVAAAVMFPCPLAKLDPTAARAAVVPVGTRVRPLVFQQQ